MKRICGIILASVVAVALLASAAPMVETQPSETMELNLASNLRSLLEFTNDKGDPREVDLDITLNGSGPAQEATLKVKPADGKKEWLTCWVKFPEITLSRVPQSIEFIGTVLEGSPNITIDAADPNGPCIAIPFMQMGEWRGEKGFLLVKGKEFMVWDEDRERELETPLRLKYMLIFSQTGEGFTVKMRGVKIRL